MIRTRIFKDTRNSSFISYFMAYKFSPQVIAESFLHPFLETDDKDVSEDGEDDDVLPGIREAERLLSRKEAKGLLGPVQTSALLGVNVEEAFGLLAAACLKAKTVKAPLPFAQAAKLR